MSNTKQKEFLSPKWCSLSWSSWVPLDASSDVFRKLLLTDPGLYRVRIVGKDALAYIGQTGRDLKERTRTLANKTMQPTPPWNDPHTAAPCLWAYRKEEGWQYSVSVAKYTGSYEERQCYEDWLLYEYRQEKEESTLANHGRFHPHWIRPSNKKKGRILEKKSNIEQQYISLPVPKSTFMNPDQNNWLGLPWSQEFPLNEANDFAHQGGVYKIMENHSVVYIGETSSFITRSKAHSKNFCMPNTCYSLVAMKDSPPHQRREREADLIGAFFKEKQRAPRYQYKSHKK